MQAMKKVIIGIIVNAAAIRFVGEKVLVHKLHRNNDTWRILMTRSSLAPISFYPFCWPSTKSSAASV